MLKTAQGRCIYQAPNGAKVYQNLVYRWLTLDSPAIQSLINRRHPEKPALSYINPLTIAVRHDPSDCCLLGLGGAGVAHALAPYVNKIFAVENNQDVIAIAKDYFMTTQLPNLTISHQDAHEFVQDCKTQYTHVLIDLYGAHSFPERCATPSFFGYCHDLLSSQGVLALNLANLKEEWPILKHIRERFDQRTILFPIKRTANLVVLAYNHPTMSPLLERLQRDTSLKTLTWDARWGYVAEL